MLIKKSLFYIFSFISVALMSAVIFFGISPMIFFPPRSNILVSAFAVTLLIAAAVVKIYFLKCDDDEKAKVIKVSLWILFIFYSANLFVMLFLDNTYGRWIGDNLFNPNINYKIYFMSRTNFVPFRQIIRFCRGFINGDNFYALHAFMNVAGNFFAFAPMAFFVPVLFSKINSFMKFLVFIILLVLAVETLQFVTMTGTSDIDDLILNSCGAVMTYVLIKKTPLKKFFSMSVNYLR